MPRSEFGKPVRRQAKARSGGLCEAVGVVYGLPAGQRCNVPLVKVEYDHYPVRAADGGEATLENCAAVCPTCHKFKTAHFDIPESAKGQRIWDKANGIKKPSSFQSRPFNQRSEPRVRQLHEDAE